MSETAELQLVSTSTSTEISIVERAKLALASSHAEAVLTELGKKYIDLAEIKNKTDYQIVMGALGEFRRHRNSVERTGKAARDDANRYSKAVIAEQNRLISIIEPEENRLVGVRRVWEDEQERIRKEANDQTFQPPRNPFRGNWPTDQRKPMKAWFTIIIVVELPEADAYPDEISTPEQRVEYEKAAFIEDNEGWIGAMMEVAVEVKIEGEVIK